MVRCRFKTCQQVGLRPYLRRFKSQLLASTAGQKTSLVSQRANRETPLRAVVCFLSGGALGRLVALRGCMGGGESASVLSVSWSCGKLSVTTIPPAPRVLCSYPDSRPSSASNDVSLSSPLLLSCRHCRTSSHIQVRTSFVTSTVGLRLRPQGTLIQPEFPPVTLGAVLRKRSLLPKRKVVFLQESRCSVLENITLRRTEGCSEESGVTKTRLLFQEGLFSTQISTHWTVLP